jgi:hypothetical protein
MAIIVGLKIEHTTSLLLTFAPRKRVEFRDTPQRQKEVEDEEEMLP